MFRWKLMQKEGCNFLSNRSLFRWHCDIRSCSGCVCFSPIVAEGGLSMKAGSRQSLSPVGISIGFNDTDPLTQMITMKTIKTSSLELAHFFCKSLMIWKPQEGIFIAFLSLDSMFPYLRLVCATTILVGWLGDCMRQVWLLSVFTKHWRIW